ncbi:MAG: DHA2 family efflux MFS transporter permease subunit [Deltaproteobacteria bacterium]|nr:DHA2 family efflux MFS transporter permease subunit [Deltaproteobacteria bacterium]
MVEKSHKHYKWIVLALVVVSSFMAILDVNIVTVGLPKMMSHFGINVTDVEWVMIAYTMAYSIIILPMAFIRRKWGIKYPFIISIAIFVVGSALCGLAPTFSYLVIFRIIQAFGGAGLTPTGLTLLAEVFPPDERGEALGIWSIGAMVAPAAGPALGGYLVDYVNWRWIFYVNVPIGIISILGSIVILMHDIPIKKYTKKFDILGFLFIALSMGSLLYALNEGQTLGWHAPIIIQSELISGFSFVFFVVTEMFVETPILNLNIFKNYNFTISAIVNMVRAVGIFGAMFLLPLYIENVLNYNAMYAGILMAPTAIAVAFVSPFSGKISDRIGPRYPLFIGLLIVAASMFMFDNLSLNTSIYDIVINQLIRGVGIGLLNAPVMSAALNSVKKELIPEASGLIPVTLQVGASFGIAFIGNELVVRQVYHLNQYARDIKYNFYAYHNIISFINGDLISKAPSYFRPGTIFPNPSLSFFDYIVQMLASIASYGDSFAILGYITLAGAAIAFFIKNKKSGINL